MTVPLQLVQSGFSSLVSYLAAHVLLCLLPAFFIAGALSALFPKETITRFLGKNTPKWISYPAAALGGFFLSVCSCTIMPLFASIYKKGAGLGPAITFLFVGPAVNILAISFTGVQIGMDIALARIILSLVFGMIIGLIMAAVFRKDDEQHDLSTNHTQAFQNKGNIPSNIAIFFVLLLVLLISGTLQIDMLTRSLHSFSFNSSAWMDLQTILDTAMPANPSLGIEGVSVQGLILILLLIVIAVFAMKGFKQIDKGYSRWTDWTLLVIVITLLIASFKTEIVGNSILVHLTGKTVAVLFACIALGWMIKNKLTEHEVQEWIWESWRFVEQIIPLLLAGVFVAGIARSLIPSSWIQTIAGSNTILANFAGVIFGVFMYFPTLVEVPIAKTFLSLGMHRGPLLAYLLADPELSVQSILITNSVLGKKKTFVYVVLVTIFSTLAGWLFGNYFV